MILHEFYMDLYHFKLFLHHFYRYPWKNPDFYQQILNPKANPDFLIKLSKRITLTLAIISLIVAVSVSLISPTRTLFWFVIFGWSGIAATFCPVIILAIFWDKLTEKGAIYSMISGFLCVPMFIFVIPKITLIVPYIEKLDVLLPSIMIAMLAGIIVSNYAK